jgi:hypothetical protein
MDDQSKSPARPDAINRRDFLGRAGAAALSLTILPPGIVRGTQANSRIRLGLVGCGGRGAWIAELFRKHGGYEITAAADYFRDRVDAFGAAEKKRVFLIDFQTRTNPFRSEEHTSELQSQSS